MKRTLIEPEDRSRHASPNQAGPAHPRKEKREQRPTMVTVITQVGVVVRGGGGGATAFVTTREKFVTPVAKVLNIELSIDNYHRTCT